MTEPGGWYLYVTAPSAGVKPSDIPFRTILARAGPAEPKAQEASHATTSN